MGSSGGELGQKGVRETSHQGTERKWGGLWIRGGGVLSRREGRVKIMVVVWMRLREDEAFQLDASQPWHAPGKWR